LNPAHVSAFSWDYKSPQNQYFMSTEDSSEMESATTATWLTATLLDHRVLSPHHGDDYDDLVTLGHLSMRRHDFATKCFQGEGSVRSFCAGEYFGIEGHPE